MKQLKLLFTVLFLAVLGLGNVWGETTSVTLDIAGQGKWTNNVVAKNGVTMTITSGSLGSNDTQTRLSSGAAFTITAPSGKKVTSAEITTNSTNTYVAPLANSTYTGSTCTVDGTKATITVSTGHTSIVCTNVSGAIRITSCTVTIDDDNTSGGDNSDGDGEFITIDASKITDFSGSYADRTWSDNGVSGKCYAYRAGSSDPYLMQFNSTPYVYNTIAIPGRIKSITITKGGGTDRSWSVYGRTTAYQSTDGTTYGTQIGTTQTVSTDYTWTVPEGTNYSYFYILKGSSSTQISSIVIEYEEIPGGDPDPVASFEVSPATIDFGSVEQGASVTAQDVTVTLTNTDYAIATLSGTNASAFEIVAGEELTETGVVSVRPTTAALAATGTYTASLDVEADGVDDEKSVTISLTVTAPAVKHNVIWSVNGATTNEEVAEGATITFATPDDALIPDDVVFRGWAAAAIVGTQADAPEFVTEATMGAEDVTYFAVFATEAAGESYWVETAIANLSSSDIFVFSNSSYAMTNNNGASAAPSASSITVNSGKITSEVADNMKWKLSGNGTDGYVFYPYNTTTSWLYCNTTATSSSNNNLRVGTGDRKLWVVNSDNYLLTNDSHTARYICFYSTTPDFRGYTSTSSAFVPKFYKYTTNHTYSDYCTSVVVKTLTGIEVTGTPAELWKGDEFSHDGITVTAKYSNAADEDVTADASFSGYDMAVAGEQTVTVAYKGQETSYDITVKTIANTQATAYTVAEARALIDASKDLGTPVYVKGKVSKIETAWSDQYNNATYNISEDGETTSAQFQLFRCVTNNIAVGGDVVALGTLTKYGSTYEFATGNSVVAYTAPEKIREQGTISGTNKTSLSTDDADDVYEITYNGDGELSVLSSNTDVATISLEGTTITVHPVAAGSTTITISAPQTENYTAATKSYTLTVSAGLSAAALPFEFNGGRGDMNVANGIKHTGLGTDYTSSPKLKFDNAKDEVVIRVAEAIKKVTYTVKANTGTGDWAGQFDVLQSTDGKVYTSLASLTSMAKTNTTLSTDKPAADTRYIKFVLTTQTNGNVALGAINITAASVIDPAGLAFEKASYRFLTTESKAVVATSAAGSDGAITYSCEDANLTINATTGAITCTTAGTYTINATIAATADYEAGNASCTVEIIEPAVANSIIVAEADGKVYAMTNTFNTSYITSVAIEKIGSKYIVANEDTYNSILYTTNTVDGKTTIVSQNNQYLQATAAKAVSFTDDEYKWTNADGVLTAADAAYGTLQYNTGSPRFTTYTSKVGQYAQIVSLENVVIGEKWTREFTSSNMGTHCYPFTIPAGAYTGATFYVPAYRLGDTKLYWDEVAADEDIVAGHPYLIVPDEDATELVAAKQNVDGAVAQTIGGFVGSFTQEIITANDGNYIVYQNQFRLAGANVAVGANRAYIHLAGVTDHAVASAPGRRRIEMSNADATIATGIDELNAAAEASKVLINGQLFIIRGEKMFDAAGNLVK